MPRSNYDALSKRERQVIEILHRLGSAPVSTIADAMPDGPSYDSVRMTLAVLERKGHVRHSREGRRYVYAPRQRTRSAARSALSNVVDTFFRGSVTDAVHSLLDEESTRISNDELEALEAAVARARKQRGR